MKIPVISTLLIILIFIATGCCSWQKTDSKVGNTEILGIPGPKAIIYKTRKDYSQMVPIILSDDKKSIVSYPDMKDLRIDGKFMLPTPLKNGFLLDNRGINANVAFISLTYDQYANLVKTPNSEELMKLIIDKKPLKKMYIGGLKSKYKNMEDELNAIIESGDFSSLVKLK